MLESFLKVIQVYLLSSKVLDALIHSRPRLPTNEKKSPRVNINFWRIKKSSQIIKSKAHYRYYFKSKFIFL